MGTAQFDSVKPELQSDAKKLHDIFARLHDLQEKQEQMYKRWTELEA
mgnify:CR=1 FL=1